MALDPGVVGTNFGPAPVTWDSRDAIIYALGVGAGRDELSFTTENTNGHPQRVLPTAGTVFGEPVKGTLRSIGDFDLAKLLHVEQELRLAGPIPVEMCGENTSRIAAIYDKGSRAIVVVETTTRDSTGDTLFVNRSTLLIAGAGGFGGDPGPSRPKVELPDGPADDEVKYQTSPDQALIYRLSGDRNPLHSDPGFARRGGFDAPILHGLCTYGFTGRALLDSLCAGDVDRFRQIAGRFTATVTPGDELVVSIWHTGAGEATFVTRRGDGKAVLEGSARYI